MGGFLEAIIVANGSVENNNQFCPHEESMNLPGCQKEHLKIGCTLARSKRKCLNVITDEVSEKATVMLLSSLCVVVKV